MIKIKYGKGSPHLFIDRLVVKLNFLPGESAYQTHSALFTIFDDPESFSGTSFKKPNELSKKIVLASVANSKHHPHLIYRHADHQAQWMRLTLHPREMGLQGFENLHSVLIMFVENGWGGFVAKAKVTQIEVSIDLEGIPFNSVHVLPDQAKTVTVFKSGQKIETVYFNKSKSSQTVVYDRAAKRQKKGQDEKAGPCTRIERKKSSLNLCVHQLGELTNPFSHIKFVAVPAVPPPDEAKEYLWTLFTDAVAQRGLDPALKMLPQAKRTAYRKYLAAQKKDWWLPGAIWLSWPSVLEDLKLTDAKFWT
ncbi:hypothetical protein [Salipiger marinus]|uniref:hypothetical protein n=1 Tax=Salipiger marinus TaxID=555512 RepID=UPI004059D45E